MRESEGMGPWAEHLETQTPLRSVLALLGTGTGMQTRFLHLSSGENPEAKTELEKTKPKKPYGHFGQNR